MVYTKGHYDGKFANPAFWYESILSAVDFQDKIVLDVGSAEGRVSQILKCDSYCIDLRKEALLFSKHRSVCADATNIPLKKDCIDVILAFELLEHIPNPEKALNEFARIIKSGGKLVITTPTPKSKTANFPDHISIRTRKHWINEVRTLGFSIKIHANKYPVHIKFFPNKVNKMFGKLIGVYKKHIKVTSTKIIAIKK